MNTPIDIVIMAAGKGTRMKSATPKVLQKLAHQGLVQHVLDTAAQLQARQVVVITGHEAELVEAALAQTPEQASDLAAGQIQQPRRQFVRQMPQLGTGHAVQQAVPVLADDGIVVVLSGDVPLTQAATVQELVRQCAGTQLALLTLAMPNPFGYGRVMRNTQGHITRIVEQKDGTPEELAVNEIYSGILAAPARLDVRGSLQCGQDVEIDVNCVFEGKVTLGNRVRIAANCVLANCQIGDDAVIHPFTHIDGEKAGASVGAGSLIGPFARLRPGAQLAQDVHIGNFVEVKNSTLAAGAKANHLAYLGDADVGERVNYGAGSITANYDGANKHRTVIEADVHIGSNSVLIAPVTIGAGGTVGAGSAISHNTPAGALTVTRGEQRQKPNYRRPVKQPKG